MKEKYNMKSILILYIVITSLIGQYTYAASHKGKQDINSTANVRELANLKPGEWYEVPDTQLIKVAPVPPPGGHTSVSEAIMSAWNGGAYDTKRDRLIVWGGGHTDYGGNEIYVFDINKLKWGRITEPSPTTLFCGELNRKAGQTDLRWNGDGTPVAHHTYGGLQYIPSIDKFWAQVGSPWCTGGSDELTWVFDFDTLKWERRADAPGKYATQVSSYDPVTGHIFILGQTTLNEYDPVQDRWTSRSNPLWQNGENTAVIDPVRRRFIVIGNGDSFYYDLSEKGKLDRKKLLTTGDNEIVSSNAPGLVYDPVIDKIVAWSGATAVNDYKTGKRIPSKIGANVYTLDLNTLVWARHVPASSVKPPSVIAHTPWGTFGRWQYIPSKDLFIGVNSVHTNVYFYNLSSDINRTVKERK